MGALTVEMIPENMLKIGRVDSEVTGWEVGPLNKLTQGSHSPQMVSAIVAKKLYTGSRGRPAKFCPVGQNTYFVRHLYSLSIFSVGCIKTPWGDAPSLVPLCSTFIVDETFLLVCRYVEPFRSYWRAGLRNLRFPPRQILGAGEKLSKVGFKAWTHTRLCENFVAVRLGTAEIHCLES